MNPIDRLTEIFSHFPGIGPRQAKRFVYYLLSRDQSTLDILTENIDHLKQDIAQCNECKRFYPSTSSGQVPRKICPTCADESRDHSLLMIVPRDADFEAIEKSGSYKGYYFILGGSLPILEKEPAKRIRISDLQNLINKKKDAVKEIILAMNANAEGENTSDFLRSHIKDLYQGGPSIQVSELGRGLSTGSELECADPETLKNALLHRTR
ncbi:toprim domain-containing protein [Candidatus Parcubacteria bacterium]|nr:toprim domain-containing protein [Candidatus Parcubacteria bacterium]